MRQLSARGWRTREPLDETLELKGPSSLKEAVGLLLDNDVFTPSSFLTEFSSTYAALTGTEVERLLSLPPGTLSIEPLNHKTLSMKIKPATSDMC